MTPYDAPYQPTTPAVHASPRARLTDSFGRAIDYVRVSVTDRCDLRCAYCMPQNMVFLPRKDLLSIEELDRLCSVFIGLGTRKLRLTGGEPLVRKGFMELVQSLSRHLRSGDLQELTLTTNGTRLAAFAEDLARFGVQRINVSLDTLDPAKFRTLTRGGDLSKVRDGLAAAKAAGLKVKINTVALKRDNLAEIPSLMAWAHGEGFDLTLIETMPMGEIEGDRTDQYVSLSDVRAELAAVWTLTAEVHDTGGPARYMRVAETGGRIGFITPLSHNFCDTCNRVRVTCTGTLHTCLGQDDATDLRDVLRGSGSDAAVRAAIEAGIAQKPKSHDFLIGPGSRPAVARHMSTTGG
jgi:cyclic pyranopterin phosphate synthase